MFVVLFRKVLCIAVDFLPTSPSWHLPSSDRFVSVEVTNLSDFVLTHILRDHCISFRQLPCESRSMACRWCFRPMRLKRWRSYDGFDNSRALVPSGRARVRKSRSCSAKGLKDTLFETQYVAWTLVSPSRPPPKMARVLQRGRSKASAE